MAFDGIAISEGTSSAISALRAGVSAVQRIKSTIAVA
jgi:hypothetical protein